MSNSKKMINVFISALGVEESVVTDNLKYGTIPQWESVAHMNLITELEDAFDLMLDTDDIIDMNSVTKAKSILIKHGVSFDA